ncbi:MAG: ATP-binding protein, partial [Bacteroidota bacterium]
ISKNGIKCGLERHAKLQLFNKFYRLPGTRSGGTGLGLTITRAIIEAHGGSITAHNHDFGGLAITIKITSV